MAWTAPTFWWKEARLLSWLLMPITKIYEKITGYKLSHQPPMVDCPVLCVGNLTFGGAGKTPIVRALARQADLFGLKIGIVLRGFGGKITASHCVDIEKDSADDVGDEALMLAQENLLVCVGIDRWQSAQLLLEQGCQFILMDDGFQSRRLHFDAAILVFDSFYGIGNELVFPSGPLRADLKTQLALCDQLLILGEGPHKQRGTTLTQLTPCALQMVTSRIYCVSHLQYGKLCSSDDWQNFNYLAFSGIGHPQKFFLSLKQAGLNVKRQKAFPDHYVFREKDLKFLTQKTQEEALVLATTLKDYMRLQNHAWLLAQAHIFVFDIDMAFSDSDFAKNIFATCQERFAERLLSSTK